MSNAGPVTAVGPTDTGANYVDVSSMPWGGRAVCWPRSRKCAIRRGLQ
jgi:hypothetical protein